MPRDAASTLTPADVSSPPLYPADLTVALQAELSMLAAIDADYAEKRLRLQILRVGSSDTFEARVSIVSDDQANDLRAVTAAEFSTSPDALSRFLTDIQHLVERRLLGDATLDGDADAHA